MKLINLIRIVCLLFILTACHSTVQIQEVEKFENVNHPRVLYWFWSPDVLVNERYISDLDSIADKTPFDLIFITARDGVDFYDYKKMHPIFTSLVKRAHERKIKIGLQLWDGGYDIPLSECMRIIEEKETVLDSHGTSSVTLKANHVRSNSINRHSDVRVQKSELFKVWAFKKETDGTYLPGSLSDITNRVNCTSNSPGNLNIKIDEGKKLAGFSIYILGQHYYNWSDMYGGYVSKRFKEAFINYASIPFDATALDEYTHMRITPPWDLSENEYFSERFYSPAMAVQFNNKYATGIERAFLEMRYVATGDEMKRARSINHYMDLMRKGPLLVEKNFYDDSKRIFGSETFIGVHNTFHNVLTGDEIWQTGGNWWTIPREYGHSDENTILPVQMGIAQCASNNILYNMYYHEKADSIFKKATNDLAYGIRTHYHAYNDTHGWGVKLESPKFISGVDKIENAVSLLNRFNPALPKMDILIIFGMEALQNWFPDKKMRTKYELNTLVKPEEIASILWNQGYRVSLVSSDVITEGKLKVEKDGKLNLNEHYYDNMVYLYPQYMKNEALELLKKYNTNKGRILFSGNYGYDFEGKDISKELNKIGIFCNGVSDIEQELNSGKILPKRLSGTASINEDGSYIETFYPELLMNNNIPFNVVLDKHNYTGVCKGMIAIQTDGKGKIIKMTAVGLSHLEKDGKELIKLSAPSDIYLTLTGDYYTINLIKGKRVIINNI